MNHHHFMQFQEFDAFVVNGNKAALHSNPSHVRVGRGSDKLSLSRIWAGTFIQKPSMNHENKKTNSNGLMDRQKAGFRFVRTRLKVSDLTVPKVDIFHSLTPTLISKERV